MEESTMANFDSNEALRKQLEEIKAARGDQVSIDEVGEVVSSIMDTLQGDMSALDLHVYRELDGLAKYINAAKADIAAVRSDDIRNKHLPDATVELDAIVRHTEEATGVILDAAETIDAEASKLESQLINDQVVLIFEACGFQDLTGQRISKIVTTLQHIEERIAKITSIFGEHFQSIAPAEIDGDADDKSEDEKLRNGPQLPANANDQADIDALLASFD